MSGNRVAANLNMLFTNVPLIERYALAAAAGFKLVEVSLPYQYEAKELRAAADKYNLSHTLINAEPGDWVAGYRGECALQSSTENFRRKLPVAIHFARVLNCPRVHVMAGIPKTPNDIQNAEATFLENIKYATQQFAENNIQCLIEPINHITIPGYFLSDYEQAKKIIEEVNSPNLKIQFDFFHAQQICGKLSSTLTRLWGYIGYVQVAQVPNRGDCSTPGEIDYSYVFNELKKYDCELIVGLEYLDAQPKFDWVQKMKLEF